MCVCERRRLATASAVVGDEAAEEEDEGAEEEAGDHGDGQLEVGGGREVLVVVGGESFDRDPGGGFEVQGLLLALGLGVHDERDDEAGRVSICETGI